jgi:hypothetical protein
MLLDCFWRNLRSSDPGELNKHSCHTDNCINSFLSVRTLYRAGTAESCAVVIDESETPDRLNDP